MDFELRHARPDQSEQPLAIDLAPSAIRQATAGDTDAVYDLVQCTIHMVYPSYYEPAIVEGFAAYHSREAIAADIAQGKVHVLATGSHILATGSVDGHFITRVYVAPAQRGKGFGSAMMDWLEALVAGEHEVVSVESSVVAEPFYQRRGYHWAREEEWEIEPMGDLPGATLVYKVLEKWLGEERA